MINICFCSLIPKYKRQPSYVIIVQSAFPNLLIYANSEAA